MAGEQDVGSFPYDLRTLAMVAAWNDPALKAELVKDPDSAMKKICEAFGIPKPDVKWKVVDEEAGSYTIVLSANPLGKPPSAMSAPEVALRGKTGFVCGYTADSGCEKTYTGGCPCGRTLAGSPCLGCAISKIVCPSG